MISKEKRQAIWALYENEHMPKSKIARKLGVSRNKVIETLKDEKYRNAQLLNTMEKINKESNESLINMLKTDERLPSIASKILNLMNDDKMLEAEITKNGLRPLATVLGILSDKSLKAKELDIKENTPEASTNVTIINDSDKIKFKEEDKEDYGTSVN